MNPDAAHVQLLRRLRQHLRHHSGAGVVYLFSDYPLANQWLSSELDAHLRARSRRLQVLRPVSADATPADVLAPLLAASQATPCMPYWLALGDPDPAWDHYRDQALARLNENRAAIERGGVFVFLLLPTRFENRAAEVAPDLWSVRSASYVVAPWRPGAQRGEAAEMVRVSDSAAQSGITALPSAALVKRWEKQWQAWQRDRTQLLSPLLARQLARQYLEQQQPQDAQPFAAQALEISRHRVNAMNALQYKLSSDVSSGEIGHAATTQGMPLDAGHANQESLRDLSVSLDIVGVLARDMGQLDDARKVFQESLEIRRRLVTLTADAPQSLRDLSVSLDNVGDVARDLGRLEDARKAYQDGLDISRRLAKLTGDSPQSLRDLSVSMNKVGDVARDLGLLEDAHKAFQDSLEIRRRLVRLTGDSPQSLRDLSLSLHRIGDVARDLGQFDEARKAWQESLGISRRLEVVTGGYAQILNALEKKIGDVVHDSEHG